MKIFKFHWPTMHVFRQKIFTKEINLKGELKKKDNISPNAVVITETIFYRVEGGNS